MLCQLLRIYGLRVVGVVGSQSKVSSCKVGESTRCFRIQGMPRVTRLQLIELHQGCIFNIY